MGISTLYNIGASGVRAQRLAIEVTGQNIANVNTEGYSRQQVIFSDEAVSTTSGFPLGTGVKVEEIQRSYDALLQRQLVDAGSSLAQSEVEESALQRIEPLFNEIGADGLGKAISDYFGAWQDLSLNPTGTAERQSVHTRAQILTDTFHQVSTGLQATVDIANASLTEITQDISELAKNVARLNEMIVTSERLGNGASANELRDQRDLLVQQLGEQAGITYYENRDGTVDVKLAGNDLVVGQRYAQVYNYPKDSAQPASIYVTTIGTPPTSNSANPPDMLIYSQANVINNVPNPLSYLGRLGGTLNVRDNIIPNIQGKVDTLANNLATTVNAAHAAGTSFDALGNPVSGINFFAPATPPATVTAASIRIDPALTATTIAAAAGPGTLIPGNNANARTIAALQSVAIGNGYTSLVSEIGVSVQNAENVAKNNTSFLQQITNLRESNSGVSLDEELTNLVKYQRAFEGSAKLINTATEMLDVILGLVR